MFKIVIFLVCALCVCAQVTEEVPPPPITFTILPTNSTTPITPTVKPTNATTTSTTTTTTPVPPTTKPTNATTTTSTTTTTTTTTTTPVPPTTKPTNATTTTKKPTPAPTPNPPTPTPVGPPAINNFTGNYSHTDRICLMMKMAVQLVLLDKNSTKINVTENATFNSSCEVNSTTQRLGIFWGSNNLMFTFFKNGSQYDIQSVNVTILLPGTKQTDTYYHRKPEFSVSDGKSYKCVKDQPLNLTDFDSKTTYAQLHVSHLQYQAFMNTTKAQYDAAWYCDATNTADIVPVVVGCVLAVLVVLVLVAYLFGRRRCQARGYLSMFTEDKSESDYIPMKTLNCFK